MTVKRRRIIEDDEEEKTAASTGEQRDECTEEEKQQEDQQQRVRRYDLRTTSSRARSGRLVAVDAVLEQLRRQRTKEEQRDWIVGAQPQPSGAAGNDDGGQQDEQHNLRSADGDGEDAARLTPTRRQLRCRTERKDERAAEGDEDDDEDGWIVEGPEDDDGGADAAIDRMRLHHQLELEGEGLSSERHGAAAAASGTSASSSSLRSTSLFGSPAARVPLGAEDGFRYWLLYLCSVLVDGDVSGWLQSLPSTSRLVASANQAVEETFRSQMNAWVKSSMWEQRGRDAFRRALDTLPYATSAPLTAADSVDKRSSQPQLEPQRSCRACGKPHRPTHRIKLFGVAYQPDQLQHPFRSDDIFPDGVTYAAADFDVGELCHARCRLYHAMRHFKLHVLLGLRALLSRLHARPRDVEHNRALIADMFGSRSAAPPPSSSSSQSAAASATAVFMRQQQERHSHLRRWSELYTSGDARTVRLDVAALDELYDFADDACASFLFDLRPTDAAAVHHEEDSEHEQPELPQQQNDDEDEEEDDAEASAASAVPEPRRLLLRAVASGATRTELRCLYGMLDAERQRDWRHAYDEHH